MNQHRRRAWRLLRAALRYLWWSFDGTPQEKAEQWREAHPDYVTLRRVRLALEEEARKRQMRETLPYLGGFQKDARRRGWWSQTG